MSTLRVTGLKQETSSATNISMAVGGGVTVAGIATFHNNAIFTNDVTVTGNISVGGTLTYQDVTDVDSIGIITARSGLNVTGGSSYFLGEVGIGTNSITSFTPTLQVAGTDPCLLLEDTATSVDYFGVNIGSGVVNAWYDDASALAIYTASSISGAGLVERLRLNSDGKLILSGTARTTPFISGDGGMCIEQSYAGNLKALSIRNKSTDAAAATALSFSLNRSGGDQDFEAGEIKLEKEQNWTGTSTTIDGAMVFSTIENGSLGEKLRIDSSGNLSFSQEASSSPYPEQKIKWSNDSTTANGFYISQGTDRNGKIWHEQGLDIQFGTSNAERMRITSAGELLHYGSSSNPGGATVTKKETVSGNSTLDLQIPGVSYIGYLYVMSIYAVNASVRTSRIYFITGRYGNSTVVTQLQTDDGSNGGRTFSIADVSAGVSNIIRFTDTSTTSNIVSMHFVGAIGS